ncbi:MAG: hypothetical protein EB060_06635 [Proteobacteria bacterium]|nr:hypothetical protein [Pseudomonadota bacterium]
MSDTPAATTPTPPKPLLPKTDPDMQLMMQKVKFVPLVRTLHHYTVRKGGAVVFTLTPDEKDKDQLHVHILLGMMLPDRDEALKGYSIAKGTLRHLTPTGKFEDVSEGLECLMRNLHVDGAPEQYEKVSSGVELPIIGTAHEVEQEVGMSSRHFRTIYNLGLKHLQSKGELTRLQAYGIEVGSKELLPKIPDALDARFFTYDEVMVAATKTLELGTGTKGACAVDLVRPHHAAFIQDAMGVIGEYLHFNTGKSLVIGKQLPDTIKATMKAMKAEFGKHYELLTKGRLCAKGYSADDTQDLLDKREANARLRDGR